MDSNAPAFLKMYLDERKALVDDMRNVIANLAARVERLEKQVMKPKEPDIGPSSGKDR